MRSEPSHDELVSLVYSVAERMRYHFAATAAAWGLTPPQAKALRFLAAAGPSPMRDLAESLHVDASYITSLVDLLERKELAQRRPAAGDRRSKVVGLTHEGHAIVRRLWRDVVDGAPVVHALAPPDQRVLATLLSRAAGPARGCWCPGLGDPTD
jgi:DNA-binding MarR family transcriptional regulator